MAFYFTWTNGAKKQIVAADYHIDVPVYQETIKNCIVVGLFNGEYVGLAPGEYTDYNGHRWRILYDATIPRIQVLFDNGNLDYIGNNCGAIIMMRTDTRQCYFGVVRPFYDDQPAFSVLQGANFTDFVCNYNGNTYSFIADGMSVAQYRDRAYVRNIMHDGSAFFYAKDAYSGSLGGIFPYLSSYSNLPDETQSIDEPDPYGDDEGGEEGGEGDHDDDTDEIDEPDLPNIGATDTGLITIFRPNKYQLKALSEYFWSSDILHFLQNQVEGISDMFIGLGIVPIDIPSGGVVNVKWLGLNTGVELTLCGQQYFTIDCGSIEVKEYWGSALDYSPYTTIQIYLPFIGSKSLDVDEVMNKTLNVKYHVDIASGTCVAFIIVDGTVMYQFTGNVVTEIPLTSVNYDAMITNATNMALAASAYHAASGAHTEAQQMLNDASTKAEINRADGYVKSTQNTLNAKGQQLAGSSVSAVMGSKPHFEKTGSIAASAGMLAIKKPYLTIIRPRMSRPEHYNHYVGLPCNKEIILSTLTGFTVIEDIRLNDLVATSDEIAEIYELLRKGVIL